MLLDARADPTVGCKAFGTGNNTLHKASQCNDETMVRLLLASGTLDINSAGAGGWTPLGLAARSGYAQVTWHNLTSRGLA
jgi:ankyrin repeat protein